MTQLIASLILAGLIGASAIGPILSLNEQAIYTTLVTSAKNLQGAARLHRFKSLATGYRPRLGDLPQVSYLRTANHYRTTSNKGGYSRLEHGDCQALWDRLVEHNPTSVDVQADGWAKNSRAKEDEISIAKLQWLSKAAMDGTPACHYQLTQNQQIRGSIVFNLISGQAQVLMP